MGYIFFFLSHDAFTDIFFLELIKKTAVYLNAFLYVIREMEVAITSCQGSVNSVSSWDSAFAIYAGSLEGVDGSGSGNMLYNLADIRCPGFKTCGVDSNESNGTSFVNIEILKLFSEGQSALLKNDCKTAEARKSDIEKLMPIPPMQGLLRYSWLLDYQIPSGDKAASEGLSFASAILPFVHSCSESDAATIANTIKLGGDVSFLAVKGALERNYACLGITCKQVGGLIDSANNTYRENAEPCVDTTHPYPTSFPVLRPSSAPEPVVPVRVDDDPVPAPFLAPAPVFQPVLLPSKAPGSNVPVRVDDDPVLAPALTLVPENLISKPTMMPVRKPYKVPTRKPTKKPFKSPTRKPTKKPSKSPTRKRTKTPSKSPTRLPLSKPSKVPTSFPTGKLIKLPSHDLTNNRNM
jgi:hypothetical protein